MRITCLLFFLMVTFRSFPQQTIDYENKSLDFFLKHRDKFGLNKSEIILYDSIISQTLNIDVFLLDGSWHKKGIVKEKDYTLNDSILNSNRKEKYKLTRQDILLKQFIRSSYNNGATKYLDIYKRFYYGGFAYVYIQVSEENISHSVLLKYNYRGNIIDYYFSSATY